METKEEEKKRTHTDTNQKEEKEWKKIAWLMHRLCQRRTHTHTHINSFTGGKETDKLIGSKCNVNARRDETNKSTLKYTTRETKYIEILQP